MTLPNVLSIVCMSGICMIFKNSLDSCRHKGLVIRRGIFNATHTLHRLLSRSNGSVRAIHEAFLQECILSLGQSCGLIHRQIIKLQARQRAAERLQERHLEEENFVIDAIELLAELDTAAECIRGCLARVEWASRGGRQVLRRVMETLQLYRDQLDRELDNISRK